MRAVNSEAPVRDVNRFVRVRGKIREKIAAETQELVFEPASGGYFSSYAIVEGFSTSPVYV
jgi:hypothetical protein